MDTDTPWEFNDDGSMKARIFVPDKPLGNEDLPLEERIARAASFIRGYTMIRYELLERGSFKGMLGAFYKMWFKCEPDRHKRQYREAWNEYRTNFDEERKLQLERAMDNAQNSFEWDEFQEFKVTLEGYVEYWGFLKDQGMKAVAAMARRQRKVEDREM